MRLKRVELLSHIRPPWSKDFVAELMPPSGYTVHYENDTVYILQGDVQRAILHGSMARYAECFDEPVAIPEPEPTSPSLVPTAPPKRRGRPPKNK